MTGANEQHALALLSFAEAGHFTIPEPLGEACQRFRRVEAAIADVAVAPAYREDAFNAAVEAVAAGDKIDLHDLVTARAQEQAQLDLSEVLTRAHDNTLRELTHQLYNSGTAIIVEHLRPALLDVVTAARELSAKFLPHGRHDDEISNAPRTTRTAFANFKALLPRLDAIFAARAHLVALNGLNPQHDPRNWFAMIRNADAVIPAVTSWQIPSSDYNPWPTDPVERLLWMTRDDVDLWVPTLGEQDAHAHEIFAEHRARREQEMAMGVATAEGVA